MDAVDLAILREMLRERVFFWNALDPLLSTDAIARRLRLSRSTVHARLRAWSRSGFLVRREVVPHPGLFGVGLGGGGLRVEDARVKESVLESLALVPGAFSALDHLGPWVAVCFARESQAALDRRLALVRKLPGVAEMTPCSTVTLPPLARAPSPLDWRIVAALREDATRPLAASARAVGVSAKTFSRRYQALIRDGLVWFMPVVDFTRVEGTIVRLILDVAPNADRAALAKRLRDLPGLVDLLDVDRLMQGSGTMDAFVHAANAASAEEAERAALAMPGVVGSEAMFPRSWRFYGAFVDDALALKLAGVARA